MARSYGSYFREREKDKPYRGAELALGFLGELISSKNQQALQYDKLMLEKEKASALEDYREQTLAANIKQIDPRKGPAYQYNPETKSYDILEGAGAGGGAGAAGVGGYGTNWGQIYAERHKSEYLDGLVEYGEDANGDGVPDRTYVGPNAELFRKYKTAKAKGEAGYEGLHPDKVVEGYRNMKNPSEEQKQQILDYFNNVDKYRDRYGDFELLSRVAQDPYAKEDDARKLFENIQKKYAPKKMTSQQRMGAQGLMNRRNVLRGYLEGQTSVTRFTEPTGWDVDMQGPELQQESVTLREVVMTEKLKNEYIAELQGIEGQLGELGIQYSKFDVYDPLCILGK